jgi:hypothetical protein
VSDPKDDLADRLVEAMRTPPDPAAEAAHDAFEEKKADELAAWMKARKEGASAASSASSSARATASVSPAWPPSPAFQRVLAEPSSLAAREALAADYRANGDPRAELIDKQLRLRKHRLARTVSSDEANALARETYVLVRKHGAAWAGELAKHVNDYTFHRGCIAEVTLPGITFGKEMPPLLRHAPIQHLNLVAPLALEEVVRSPHFARLTSLKIVEMGKEFGDKEAAMLAESPYSAGLKWIYLVDNSIGEAGVEALVASPYLASCIRIDLSGNPVDVTPGITTYEGIEDHYRSGRADELERKYGKRPWLAAPSADLTWWDWPPNRDDTCTTP